MSDSFFRYNGKRIYTGYESSGKTLMMAKQLRANLRRNIYYKKAFGITRPIMGNISFSDYFIENAAQNGIPVKEWHDLDELPKLKGVDLYIDELAVYFDARLYADLPINVRRWLPQSEKLGVRLFGAAQDYGQIDKNFRRLVQELFEVKKAFGTRRPALNTPPVSKNPWGMLVVHQLNPRDFDGDQTELTTKGFPSFHFFGKSDIKIFDTNKMVIESPPPPLKHVERYCEICKKAHVKHY